MLRRKFLLVMGSLVGLLLATAITAILFLHGILRDLDTLGAEAMEGTTIVLRLGTEVASIQAELNRFETTHLPDPAATSATIQTMREQLEGLAVLKVIQQHPGAADTAARLMRLVSQLQESSQVSQGGEISREDRAAALRILPPIRRELAVIDDLMHRQVEEERGRVVDRFRLVALGLGLVFLVVINISVIVLSRAMNMVMKPVESLVEASRHWAREDFAHRVVLDRKDEFAELARAYNSLAEQLQNNERRKIEVMHQVARTLNHEVNNAVSIIELQLALAARASSGDGSPQGLAQAERLSQIRCSLARISRTVEALTRIRRIVLTDYLAGVAMLDLERSVEDEPARTGCDMLSGNGASAGPSAKPLT
jgi:methyl-accepting chemotaxis protein